MIPESDKHLYSVRPLRYDEDRNNELFATPECQMLLDMYEKYYPENGFNPPWIAYLILQNNQVLGTGSFTGSPINNEVEIAYWTFTQFEGKGVASFICGELIRIAKTEIPQIKIVAKTSPEENASTSILKKYHFTFQKVVQDHEIGDAWLWTKM
ncbi:MAG: GNAT family N-acetyltransferase [Bacteroidetes bacterium]|nr:GNAT family N-acetyltransferase [Bacteroidota bacterium]